MTPEENILYRKQLTPEMAAQDLIERATILPPLEPISQPNLGVPAVQDILAGIDPLAVPVQPPMQSIGAPAQLVMEPTQLLETPVLPVKTGAAIPAPSLGWVDPYKKALEEEAKIQSTGMTQEAIARKEIADKMGADQLELDKKVKEWNDQSDKAINEISVKSKKLAETKINAKNPFEDMSTGGKILAGISIFLMSLKPEGQALALKMIDNAMNRDIDIQKSNLANQYKGLETDKEAMSAYNQKMDRLLMGQRLKNVSTLERMKVYLDAQAAETGSKVKLANIETMKAGIDKQIAEDSNEVKKIIIQSNLLKERERVGHEQKMEQIGLTIAGDISKSKLSGQAKPSEAEKKYALQASAGEESLKDMNKLIKEGYNPNSWWNYYNKIMPIKAFETKDYQLFEDAGSKLKTAIAHAFTGAGMPASEAEEKANQYIPRPGESEELMRQKLKDAHNAIQQMKANAGSAISEASISSAPPLSGLNKYSPEEIYKSEQLRKNKSPVSLKKDAALEEWKRKNLRK